MVASAPVPQMVRVYRANEEEFNLYENTTLLNPVIQ